MIHKPQSKSTSRPSLTVVVLVAVGLFSMSGCQTFKSTFSSAKLPKLTDMKLPSPGNLAFWKKESSSVPPPPPSQHLSPSLVSGTESMVSQNSANGMDVDGYRQKIDEMKDGIASAESKLGFGSNKPIRKPYGSEESTFGKTASKFGEAASTFGQKASTFGQTPSTFGSAASTLKSEMNSGFKSAGNSIDAGLNAAKGQASTFGSNTLSGAQQKFNSAIADLKKPNANGSFRSPSEFLSTKPANDFKQALANSESQIKSGFEAAKKNTGFGNSMAKVNQSLYDMNGQLTTGAAKTTNAISNSVDAARQRFGSALGTVSDRAIEAAKNSTEFGGGLKDKIVSAASEMTPPLRGGDGTFKPAFKAATDPIKTEAQNLLNKAKDRVAGLGTGFDFPTAGKTPPPKFANAANGATAPAASNLTASNLTTGNEFNRTRVANVTPVAPQNQSSTFSGRNGLDSSLTKSWNNGSTQSQLKPIQVGVGSSTPGNGLRTASTASSSFVPNSSASAIPAAFDQNRNAMTSHVSEIDIPSKILSGSGSYAPGSVNRVR